MALAERRARAGPRIAPGLAPVDGGAAPA